MIKLYLKHIHNVNEHIQQLEFDYDHSMEFHAGQYLELVISGEKDLYFTIASSPKEDQLILLIENKTAHLIENYCKENQFIETKPPQGECHLQNFQQNFDHLYLVASGSGFSQMRAICQDIVLSQKDINVTFIWGSAEFFELDLIESWSQKINVITKKLENESQKHTELLNECLNTFDQDLTSSAVIACGSPDLAYPLHDALIQRGLNKDMMLADVFQFMPR